MIVIEEARECLNYGVIIRCFPLRAIQSLRFKPESDQVRLRLRVGTSAVGEETAFALSDVNARSLIDGLGHFAPFIPVEWTRETGASLIETIRQS